VDFSLYANERPCAPATDSDHAFLSPAATFLFVRGADDRPADGEHVVRCRLQGWQVFTA
jgi:predicted metalloprotease with PDZ domain